MAAALANDRSILNKKHPFLANFPFRDFVLEIGELPAAPQAAPAPDLDQDTRVSKYNSPMVRFIFEKDVRFSINVHENDLVWISNRASEITELDVISQILDTAIDTKDLLVRRDAVEAADHWIKKLSDQKTMLAYSTFSEALTSLIGEKSINDATNLINNINKLANKKGLVKLTADEASIVLTYYHFRLVYSKLILGIVIAAKISI